MTPTLDDTFRVLRNAAFAWTMSESPEAEENFRRSTVLAIQAYGDARAAEERELSAQTAEWEHARGTNGLGIAQAIRNGHRRVE